jgi:hypothetical protein
MLEPTEGIRVTRDEAEVVEGLLASAGIARAMWTFRAAGRWRKDDKTL